MKLTPFVAALLCLSAFARAEPANPKILARYKQMLAANPVEGIALERLWKSALDENQLIDGLDLECELDAQITQERFEQILAAVPVATRSVLLLRFRDGCTRPEIVARLGMTERQVRRHMIRGYEHLREFLKELNGVNLDA